MQKLHNHKLKKTNRKTHNITFAKLSYKDANRKTQKLTSAKLSYKGRKNKDAKAHGSHIRAAPVCFAQGPGHMHMLSDILWHLNLVF